MAKFGYDGDKRCCLCAGAMETSEHLFFECTYSSLCVQLVSDKLGVCIYLMKHRFKSLLHKKVVGAAIVALAYYVWKARNYSLHNHTLMRPKIWLKSLVSELIYRCKAQLSLCARVRFESWMSNL
ncbi:hypothetical protein RND81_08G020200 [Saponaria officinalis]|uniref:Reverse transcriptase zinc-binding domain-containing protein n=1 Tax=Saponaria officinalis TaxID=3572 RepID=A0AAW1J3Z1_SAPOF